MYHCCHLIRPSSVCVWSSPLWVTKIISCHKKPISNICRSLSTGIIKSCTFATNNTWNRFQLVPDSTILHSHKHKIPSAVFNRSFKYGQSTKKELKLRHKDGISDDYDLIYRAPMQGYLSSAYRVSLVCVVASGLYFVYYTFVDVLTIDFSSNEFIQSANEYYGALVALLLTYLAIRYVVVRFPLRIYHNNQAKSYKSVYLSAFKSKVSEFREGDLYKITTGEKDIYRVNGRKIYLLEDYFRRSEDFNRMLHKE